MQDEECTRVFVDRGNKTPPQRVWTDLSVEAVGLLLAEANANRTDGIAVCAIVDLEGEVQTLMLGPDVLRVAANSVAYPGAGCLRRPDRRLRPRTTRRRSVRPRPIDAVGAVGARAMT